MARYVCKNLVAAGVCRRVELQVAYAIGMARPVSVYVNSFGTGVVDDDVIAEIVSEVFDLRPRAIIDNLGLNRPIYRATSNYGHLGRAEFPWGRVPVGEDGQGRRRAQSAGKIHEMTKRKARLLRLAFCLNGLCADGCYGT